MSTTKSAQLFLIPFIKFCSEGSGFSDAQITQLSTEFSRYADLQLAVETAPCLGAQRKSTAGIVSPLLSKSDFKLTTQHYSALELLHGGSDLIADMVFAVFDQGQKGGLLKNGIKIIYIYNRSTFCFLYTPNIIAKP